MITKLTSEGRNRSMEPPSRGEGETMKRKPITPRSRVRACLRQLYLRSRERALALKLADYSCQECGVKQSKAKGREQAVQVHHVAGVGNWEAIIDSVYSQLLVSADKLRVLCPKCHEKTHRKR